MNCKPGDLAVYVGSEIEAHGQIVRVMSFRRTNGVGHRGDTGPSWWVDPPIRHAGRQWESVLDQSLRPIRDNDGEDETFTWAGKPEQVNA